ncbi:MAG: hypothetical protein KDH20_07845 [Rhodocyclaceae bacterium]|nr:hypothetical protein [Rhodocyclaceae bacterium]
MGIHQIQIAYEAVPDRLLLRVSTQAGEEYLAHLTRRFVRQIWPSLGPLARAPEAVPAARPSSGAGRFDKPYAPADDLVRPLGQVPLLVSEARIERDKADHLVLVLREHRARSMSLTLNDSLLQVFCAMLRAGTRAADWDLDLDAAGDAPRAPQATPPTGVLH